MSADNAAVAVARAGAKPKPKPVQRYFDGVGESSVVAETAQAVPRLKKREQKFEGEVINVESKIKLVRRTRADKEARKRNHIDRQALLKHSRGRGVGAAQGVKTDHFKDKLRRKEVYVDFANEQAARTEILRNEEEGFIVPDDGEATVEYTQQQIVANVDITAATKHFNLQLDFGPYHMRYTRNGRHLLLGGRRGHVAAFDWITKRLHCEINVQEEVTDVAWLHIETMLAVAQKNWVHFYDNQGTELHCVKTMNRVNRLEFLPYHFLLASGNDEGYLSWLDVSIGESVTSYSTRQGPVQLMCQNPTNGVLCVGGPKGVVSMWSPSTREPLAKLLCHRTAVAAMAVDPRGEFMVTSGLDKSVRVWDVRQLSGPVVEYKTRVPANEICISQKGLLALGMGNVCEVYKKPNLMTGTSAYLRQCCDSDISGMQFCAFEDVLGVTTRKGFTSLLVPGASEANFDAIEVNPYQTKSQRREFEVHALLDKVPSEFIALDPNTIAAVDVPTFKEKIDAQKKLLVSADRRVDGIGLVDCFANRLHCSLYLKSIVAEAAGGQFRAEEEDEGQGRLGECGQGEENRQGVIETRLRQKHQRRQAGDLQRAQGQR